LISHGTSFVNCSVNMKNSVACKMTDVMVDFGKIQMNGGIRMFDSGAFTAIGEATHTGSTALLSHIPGLLVTADSSKYACEVNEKRPSYILSNDDPWNLAHNMNDVIGLWNNLIMSNRDSKSALLINMDGFRAGGPAGGPPHRIVRPSSPDDFGPFGNYYYKSWFQEIKKATAYGGKRVCFSELYLPPMPGVPFIWGDWSVPSECASRSSSPLYQSFNYFLRNRWTENFGAESLVTPDAENVHIVFAVRAIEAHKSRESSARFISNLDALVSSVKEIPGVRVTVKDFAKLSIAEQVSLAHSAGVLVTMHGAGATHIVHSALGSQNCCSLVELFPDPTTGFHTIHGFGNLAKHLGMYYYRWEAPRGRTKAEGTSVDVAAVKELVDQAVTSVRTKPTCLHEVRDMRRPLWDPIHSRG
jgi:Glycosyltransferase 61